MDLTGFKWILRPEDGRWLWQVVGRDDGVVFARGHASTRAQAAAYLVQVMALGVLGRAPLSA